MAASDQQWFKTTSLRWRRYVLVYDEPLSSLLLEYYRPAEIAGGTLFGCVLSPVR